MTGKQHRYLFKKHRLILDATAEVVRDRSDKEAQAYLRGLLDGCHGTDHGATAEAIHIGRQVLLTVKDL